MNHCRHIARLALLAGLFLSPFAVAQETAGGTVALTADVEYYKWQEFFPKNTEVLDEHGPRGAIGVAWSNLRTPSGGPVYRANARLYFGEETYEGQQINSLTPVNTDSRYIGVQAEGIGGYRFGGRVGFELVSGFGFDVWQRDIRDSNTSTGYNSLFAVLNAKMGVGMFTRFDYFAFALRAGPKLPLVAWERVKLYDDVDLMPEPSLSWFGTAELNFGTTGKDNVSIVAYYDSYKFKASNAETLTNEGVPVGFSPVSTNDTEMAVYGVRLAVGF